jgi:hypothetical protein
MGTRFLLVSCALLLLATTTLALPRFASRTKYSCQSCHVNPTGGGMRSALGVQYGRDDLPMEAYKEQFQLDDFSTKITDFLSYGANFRFLAFTQQKDRNGITTSRSSFFPMQADVFFNFAISRKVSLYANPAFGLFSRYEIFAIAKVLPMSGFVKLGRFYPSYGLRVDDHTSFVREITPFHNHQGQDAGLELGLSPGPLNVIVALMNGSGSDRASDRPSAYLSNAWAQFSVGPLDALVGASTYDNNTKGDQVHLLGAYAVLSYGENFTVMVDYEQLKGNWNQLKVNSERRTSPVVNPFNTTGQNLKQRALYLEASYLLLTGIDIKLAYDFFDPDTRYATGRAARYGVGAELFPLSGVEVRPMLRLIDDSIIKLKSREFQVLFHYYL